MLPDWSDHTIDIHNTTLHFYTNGTPGKTALVLVHGFSDNALCWQPVAEELMSDFQIFIPEMRGHGQSERVQPGESFDMVADLAEFIHSLEIAHPIVAGHSMGAAIAFQFGARFPEVTAALVLEDPPWFDAPPERPRDRSATPHPFVEMVASWQGQTVDMLVERYRAEHPNWPEATLRAWCEAKTQLDPSFMMVDNMPRLDWKETLQKIRCPTLLITAEPDLGGIVTPVMAQTAMEINPNIQVAHFPGVGHHIRFATHDSYMEMVKGFLESI